MALAKNYNLVKKMNFTTITELRNATKHIIDIATYEAGLATHKLLTDYTETLTTPLSFELRMQIHDKFVNEHLKYNLRFRKHSVQQHLYINQFYVIKDITCCQSL